ncbi:MAG TPA: KilA-N domain-containing protein [Candidatus Woesearchaeota archaeon]|nr:KilA-N domain-containing protein [Candidatus Woesearchaeota archaeon]
MLKKEIVKVDGIDVSIQNIDSHKYVSLTDIAKKKNSEEPRFVVINWLRNRNTIEFLGIWEKIHNPNFNRVGFDTIRMQAGLNSFTISPSKWIEITNAKGIITKSGRYDSGTYAHEDIALEFASWISAEFKLYFIKEFRRLKNEENKRLSLGWDVKRELVKINYKIHTDAIKENLIPKELSKNEINRIYANEADVLNMALFGKTAKEWRENNKDKKGNIRDYANVTQLVVLSNLENLNSEFIKQKIPQEERLLRLNKIAISQMKLLTQDINNKLLENKRC